MAQGFGKGKFSLGWCPQNCLVALDAGTKVPVFIFLDSKITVDGDCSQKIERHLLLGRKAMTNFDSVLKNRKEKKMQRYRFANNDPYSQSYGFSSSHVWMWKLDHKEGWLLKNWFFWIVVLEKTLENPWTERRSNQSILKEINLKYSLEGLMLTLKPQYFGHFMQTADSLEKTLILGKVEGRRRSGWQRMRWLDGSTN